MVNGKIYRSELIRRQEDENRSNDFAVKYHFRGIPDSNKKLTAKEPVNCLYPVVDVQLFINVIHMLSYRFSAEK